MRRRSPIVTVLIIFGCIAAVTFACFTTYPLAFPIKVDIDHENEALVVANNTDKVISIHVQYYRVVEGVPYAACDPDPAFPKDPSDNATALGPFHLYDEDGNLILYPPDPALPTLSAGEKMTFPFERCKGSGFDVEHYKVWAMDQQGWEVAFVHDGTPFGSELLGLD